MTAPKTSETPRVDEVTHAHTCEDGFHAVEPRPNGPWVPCDFARTLERELSEAGVRARKKAIENSILAEQVAGLRAALEEIREWSQSALTDIQVDEHVAAGFEQIQKRAEAALSTPHKSQFVSSDNPYNPDRKQLSRRERELTLALNQADAALKDAWDSADLAWIADGEIYECGHCNCELANSIDEIKHEDGCEQAKIYLARQEIARALHRTAGGEA